jgi:bacterioferritin
MKGNDKVIAILNAFLADELTAISQYMVHSEMCANWQYKKLHEVTEKRAVDEMKHAEKLIARLLFLEGRPIVSQLNKISIGATVEEQLKNDSAAEVGAIKSYNEGVRICLEAGDGGSRELIEDNLEDEEEHLDWLEAQLDQISQMGLQNYLQAQTE